MQFLMCPLQELKRQGGALLTPRLPEFEADRQRDIAVAPHEHDHAESLHLTLGFARVHPPEIVNAFCKCFGNDRVIDDEVATTELAEASSGQLD